MKVQRYVVSEVVLVQGEGLAGQEVEIGVPHVLEPPKLVVSKRPAVLVIKGGKVVPDPVVRLNHHMREQLLHGAYNRHDAGGVFPTRERDVVAVL